MDTEQVRIMTATIRSVLAERIDTSGYCQRIYDAGGVEALVVDSLLAGAATGAAPGFGSSSGKVCAMPL